MNLYPFIVENQPSNATMISYYESQARNHVKQYFQVLENQRTMDLNLDLIPPRRTEKLSNRGGAMQEATALAFFEQLMESFRDFKDFCHNNPTNKDCIMMQNDRFQISDFLENI